MIKFKNIGLYAAGFVLLLIVGWFYLHQNKPEISEIKIIYSPNGEWAAKYMSSLTHLGMGGSDSTAYIEIASTKNKIKDIVVYAVSDDRGEANFEWKSNTNLIIFDNYRNIEFGVKFNHPLINIEYKVN